MCIRDSVDAANLIAPMLGIETKYVAPWWLDVKFTWFAMIGAVVVFVVGILFRTPDHVLDEARRIRAAADAEGDKPLATRA